MANQARVKYVRVPPRKARLVADLVRGKNTEEAHSVLRYTPKNGAKIVAKLLKSAVSNATAGENVDENNLYVKEIFVDPGPVLKRFMPRAMGRATKKSRRTSHITVILAER